jgi:hypothetical protein
MLPNLNQCPICLSQTTVEEIPDKIIYRVNCLRCGKYELTDEALTMFDRSDESTKVLSVSFWIRHHQSEKGRVQIYLDTMRRLLVPFTPVKPREQANNLLLWIGDQLSKPDDEIDVLLDNLIAVIGAYDSNGVDYIYRFLKDEGVFNSANVVHTQEGSFLGATLSFKGWDRYYELQRTNKDSLLAFMAMKYGDEILDKIYNDVIIKAVNETGFEIRKLDDVKRAGLIDDKLKVEIRRSKFLIADLTHDNNGSYWEAGFAEGLDMDVIYICEESKFNDKTKTTHFDTNHHLTVPWKDTPEGLKIFADELKATIRETFPEEAKMED